MYIPVVARTESVDGVMQKLNVMFVEANAERLRPLLDWSLPQGVPDSVAYLIRILRMVFRARWEILQPRFQEATYKCPSPERCTEIVRSVLSEDNQMQTLAEHEGMSGLDKFYAAFERELRTEVIAYGDEWVELIDGLRTAPPTDAHTLAHHLKLLLDNNTKSLLVCTRQFSSAVEDLEVPARAPLSASRSRTTNT